MVQLSARDPDNWDQRALRLARLANFPKWRRGRRPRPFIRQPDFLAHTGLTSSAGVHVSGDAAAEVIHLGHKIENSGSSEFSSAGVRRPSIPFCTSPELLWSLLSRASPAGCRFPRHARRGDTPPHTFPDTPEQRRGVCY